MHLMQFYTSACMLFAFTAANSHDNAIIPQHVKQVKQVAIIG